MLLTSTLLLAATAISSSFAIDAALARESFPSFEAAVSGVSVAATCAPQGTEGKPIRALDAWLKAYRGGKLDLVDLDRFKGKPRQEKDFVSIKFKVVSPDRLKDLNHEKELNLLCEAVAKLANAEAVDMLVEVAAVGLDGKKHDAQELTALVRTVGDQYLQLCRTKPAQERMREIAAKLDGGPSRAALEALGVFQDEADRPLFELALQHKDPWIRYSAARGLARAKLATTIEPIADQLVRESVEVVIGACCDALAAIADEKTEPRLLRRATTSVLQILGTHAWQVDDAALGFLEKVRSADMVPGLIALLQRAEEFANERDSMASSGVVQRRAHELLTSLTGATFPMREAAQWSSWWEKVREEFVVVEDTGRSTGKAGSDETSTGTFFGIPVRGTRVLFIVDFSGSMHFVSTEPADATGKVPSKVTVARRELRGAVEKMASDAQFNLVWFNAKFGSWKPKLVPASDSNKKGFYDFIDSENPDGGTNVWGGLSYGLGMKVEKETDRYEGVIDEIFVLSDGLPSVGEIIDPKQILDAVRDANRSRRVRINTVFVTGHEDEQKGRGQGPPPFEMTAPELMRRLAVENGGVFIQPGERPIGR